MLKNQGGDCCCLLERSENMDKKLNGYYYCLSYSDEHHEVCSIANVTREEVIQAARREGARLYLVRYRNDQQQGKKKRIPLK